MSARKSEMFARREHISKPWKFSEPWVVWSNALAAGAAVLLFGALWQLLSHDSAGAWLLSKLGAAVEVGMVVCFVLAILAGRVSSR